MRSVLVISIMLLTAGLIMAGCAIKEEPSLPEVSEEELSAAIEEMSANDNVHDAQVGIERGIIFLALRVDENTSENYARELGQEFARIVSSKVTLDEEFIGPEKDDIYDYYDLEIGVAAGEEDFIIEGSKTIEDNTISW